MDSQSPETIAAGLTEAQRDILLAGPHSFEEEDMLPDDLFTVGELWDVDSGDERLVWEPTELGEAVRALVAKDG